MSALNEDDEIAAKIAEKKQQNAARRDSLRGYSRDTYILLRGFNALLGPLAALTGAKPGEVNFLQGPQSAAERVARHRDSVRMNRGLSRALPHQYKS